MIWCLIIINVSHIIIILLVVLILNKIFYIYSAHKCSTAFMFLTPSEDINSIINSEKFKVVIIISRRDKIFQDIHRKANKSINIFNYVIDFYVCYHQQYANVSLMEYCFIAKTSGTTGQPKHVQVPVQCIQPNIDDFTKLFKMSSKDIIFFSTPLTFDPSMIEILLACENGASLLIAPEHIDILFPENHEDSITFWQTTPSKFFQIPHNEITKKVLSSSSKLKILAFGGEPLLNVKRLKNLKVKENRTKIYTLYGVTEMSCWACVAELDLNKHQNDMDIPLGDCLSETEIHINPEKNEKIGNIILSKF